MTKQLIAYFEADSVINTVTHGDTNEVDIDKATDFALAHIIYLDPAYQQASTIFSYQILLLDKYEPAHDDVIDVIDGMSQVATDFVASLHAGITIDRRIRISANSASQVIYDQFENRLYGISMLLVLEVPNGSNIC